VRNSETRVLQFVPACCKNLDCLFQFFVAREFFEVVCLQLLLFTEKWRERERKTQREREATGSLVGDFKGLLLG
jgi:hypothetical protein